MLVKHNISTFFKVDKDNLFVWDNGVDLKFEGDLIIVNRLKSGGLAYQSIRNTIELDTPTTVKFIVENINGSSVGIAANGLYQQTGVVRSNAVGKQEFEISGLRSVYYLQLQIRPTSDDECRIKIYGIRVSTGESSSDIYLPNINTLPTNQQSLLPPEGEYKEIQAL